MSTNLHVTTFVARHPTATRRILTIAQYFALALPLVVVAAALGGHLILAAVSMVAGTLCYLSGYTAASLWDADHLREQLALARRDPLTGLPHRGAADDLLTDATRSGAPMTVALADVDGLHMMNTNFGHAAGDQYLAVIAGRLGRAVPPDGLLVRQGGDEFTLLAPGADPAALATAIGAALAGPALIAGRRIQPRASVGIAASDATGAHHARARADSALYTAKADGGNQILIYRPDRDPEPATDGTRPLLRRRDVDPLAAGVAWLPSPGDDLIPMLLPPGDLRTMHEALTAARDRWAQTVAEAQTGARRPPAPGGREPGSMTIEPGPAGYRGIARLAAGEQARLERLIGRLRPVVDAAQLRTEADGSPPVGARMAGVVLVGISASFTPTDVEALVITAAQAVHGRLDELSSRQRDLAARAYALLRQRMDD